MTSPDQLDEAAANAGKALLDARADGGGWEGELSSSALSTATATFALHLALAAAEKLSPERERHIVDPASEKQARQQVAAGLAWLALHQNSDGGWGDTVLSKSNISTTALCWAALTPDARSTHPQYANVTAAAERWLTNHVGGCDPAHLAPAIIKRYGKDKTFSVPILTMGALAGRLGDGRAAWKHVPSLPFELAAFPQRWFKFLQLPVVSYALPALIAIGQLRHAVKPTLEPVTRVLRHLARGRTLRLLTRIQPSTGGFLEATPLTSFVVMSLVGAGLVDSEVVRQGVKFLVASARADGSWPIDTHLATWVTTLAVNALAINPNFASELDESERIKVHNWLMDQHYVQEHPYTLADPGGWAWTPLPGGVPDADDTAGALLALKNLTPALTLSPSFSGERAGVRGDGSNNKRSATEGAAAGIRWLLDLQNRDGGIPTFCRGWGKLPFDRSSADLTAHALRAIHVWDDSLPAALRDRAKSAAARAVEFLLNAQEKDGSWLPLWFGNQHAPDDINPTYGTARVLLAAKAGQPFGARWNQRMAAGVDWLLSTQHPSGGWGAGRDTPASIEETAIAIEALVHAALTLRSEKPAISLIDHNRVQSAVDRGVGWLLTATARGTRFDPTPIGFYFAKLWYYEKLYPVIFTVAALESARLLHAVQRGQTDSPTSALG